MCDLVPQYKQIYFPINEKTNKKIKRKKYSHPNHQWTGERVYKHICLPSTHA